jgi:hypothetical protein
VYGEEYLRSFGFLGFMNEIEVRVEKLAALNDIRLKTLNKIIGEIDTAIMSESTFENNGEILILLTFKLTYKIV